MKVTIKPHSSLLKFFTEPELQVDINSYIDILYYFHAMQPSFINYLLEQKNNNLEEGITYLDHKLREITPDELYIRKAKDGDIIYIVPAIMGGGGKRGGLLAAVAAIAFIWFMPAIAGTLGGTTVAGGATNAAVGASKVGLLAKGSFLSNLVIQVGLAVLARLFMPKTKDESTRENDAFGSLTNSTTSGTPIALNYGMVRVAGQMLSGYIKTVDESSSSVKIT